MPEEEYDINVLVSSSADLLELYKHLQSCFNQVTKEPFSADSIENWYRSFQGTVPFQRTGGPADVPDESEYFPSTENTKYVLSPGDAIIPGHIAGDLLIIPMDDILCSFRWIPAGSFTMGTALTEQIQYCLPDPDGLYTDEKQHLVTLSHGFWMMQYPVTKMFYDNMIKNKKDHQKPLNIPMTQVTWHDCIDFANRLNSLYKDILGQWRFSLPSEAQWEYACRAGTQSVISGSQDLNRMGWYEKNSWDRLHCVGCKTANAWGVYDMHGNVFEWCLDEYSNYNLRNIIDPIGISSVFSEPICNEFYVKTNICRGGSWLSSFERCRSAARGACEPSDKSNDLGFRLVLSPDTKIMQLKLYII